MSKICTSSSMDDARKAPVRANYLNLYKWPESDAEFMKSAAMRGGSPPQSRVVDSVTCRQMYLRSYTFSREETVHERTKKCLAKVIAGRQEKGEVQRRLKWRRKGQRAKELSCAALCAISRRLLFCTATVNVVDHGLEP